jgi:hypothetical protein
LTSTLQQQTTTSRHRRRRRRRRRRGDYRDDAADDDEYAACEAEYQRVTKSRVPGLTRDDFERSIAHVGNRHLLAQFGQKLQASTILGTASGSNNNGTTVVVCGGSITLGHGVLPVAARYSDQLQAWLNEMYGNSANPRHHMVYNKGSHGADMCAMAKRMNMLDLPEPPDLFILEFAVNDYQGQDHRVWVDHKTDVFFDGFRQLALCAETVVHKLRTTYPTAAIIFLEFQTAILNRKTAQVLHLGVAQHYDIPVISYADALFPDFYRLIDLLAPTGYAIPANSTDLAVLPYPHGCAACQEQHIIPQFRDKGCKSVCTFLQRSGFYPANDCDQTNNDTIPCYVPFFAHDAVHPSAVGHAMAKDLIVDLMANVNRMTCQGRTFPMSTLPVYSGWLVAGQQYHQELAARSDYVLVQDTMEIFAAQDPLRASDHSPGFVLEGDQIARAGWIATTAGEYVVFDIKLPPASCYVVYLSVLRSYETVGTMTVTVVDTVQQTETVPQTFDLVWKPRISIPSDFPLTSDETPQCTGSCQVRVSTNAAIPGRGGNTVKIMSLSVRHCLLGGKQHTPTVEVDD